MIPQRSPSSPSASHRHNNNNRKMIQWVSRPVGFVAMLVVVSVLAFMHRFRETTEPQLILASTIAAGGNSPSDQSSRAMMATGDDRTHSRLREDVKKELFAPDNTNGDPTNSEEKEPDERQVMAQLKAELAKLKEEVAQMKVERENENNAVKKAPPKTIPEPREDGNDKKKDNKSSDKKRTSAARSQEDKYKVNDNKVNWTFEGADKEEEEPTTTEKPEQQTRKVDNKQETRKSQREAKKEADRKKNEEILKERVATIKSQKKEDTQDDNNNNNNNNKKEIKPKRPRDPDMNLGKVPADPNDRPVYFLKWGEVNEKDAFSASWLQRKEEFLRMDLQRIQICEDAAFKAFKTRSFRLRMTLDWLDFSLEHLSKWWKMLKIFDFQMVFDTAKLRFDNYLAQSASFEMEKEPSFRETIAVIAFQQYKDGKKKEQSYQLTKLSLAATIESLRRAGMGRVVVVGRPRNMDPWREDPILCQDTFRHMKELVEGIKVSNQTNATMVGHMEVAFAEFNETEAKTKHLAKNVPKATLVGLKQAFDYSEKKGKDRTTMENEFITTWLGEQHPPAYWKYIYLTEPDSILQTRPGTLKRLKEEVDKGMVLVPHRLQPIPHELDAPGHPRDFLYLPKDLAPIVELDAIGAGDSCCDYHRGSLYKPGQPPMMKGCGNFWYMCDFSRRIPKANRTHDRIRQYPLIKLKSGTEIVSLSALEHGRPCKPKKNAVCLPPTDESQKKRPAIFNA